MARVTGPLFSINASGTVARRLTFRNTAAGFVVSTPPIPTGRPTTAQVDCRLSMKDAATAWAGLSANDRAIWSTPDAPTTRTGFMSFFLESKLQRVPHGTAPRIPANYLGTPTRDPFPPPAEPVFIGTLTGLERTRRTLRGAAIGHAPADLASHAGTFAWQHGIFYDHNKPDLVAHGGRWRLVAALLPSSLRPDQPVHGSRWHLASIAMPPHSRPDVAGHGTHMHFGIISLPPQDRGSLRSHGTPRQTRTP